MVLTNIFQSNITWVIIWLLVFIIALVIELTTTQLVAVWFCGGSFISIILAACNVDPLWQGVAFVLISIAALVLSKVLYKPKHEDKRTNSDSLIGKEILITEKVSMKKPGSGKVRDVEWTVSTEDVVGFDVGEYAIVESITGNRLIVKRKEN
ncbi:MAG: NfeD family protein [Bacilli bacterium]